jgi:hypothetical protein
VSAASSVTAHKREGYVETAGRGRRLLPSPRRRLAAHSATALTSRADYTDDRDTQTIEIVVHDSPAKMRAASTSTDDYRHPAATICFSNSAT